MNSSRSKELNFVDCLRFTKSFCQFFILKTCNVYYFSVYFSYITLFLYTSSFKNFVFLLIFIYFPLFQIFVLKKTFNIHLIRCFPHICSRFKHMIFIIIVVYFFEKYCFAQLFVRKGKLSKISLRKCNFSQTFHTTS